MKKKKELDFFNFDADSLLEHFTPPSPIYIHGFKEYRKIVAEMKKKRVEKI